MELLEKYFAELIQCVDASYLVIGIILVFLSVPDTADYAPYRKAKYFLASAFFVMFINLYLWLEIFSSQDWEALNSIIACMDISLFFHSRTRTNVLCCLLLQTVPFALIFPCVHHTIHLIIC
jgi:hypothetical protein